MIYIKGIYKINLIKETELLNKFIKGTELLNKSYFNILIDMRIYFLIVRTYLFIS